MAAVIENSIFGSLQTDYAGVIGVLVEAFRQLQEVFLFGLKCLIGALTFLPRENESQEVEHEHPDNEIDEIRQRKQ